MYDQFGLFIDGEWRNRNDGGKLEVTDPATGEVIGTTPSASRDDVESAIASAGKGLKIWRKTSAWTRADMLHAVASIMQTRAEEVARRITLETGKPLVTGNEGPPPEFMEAVKRAVAEKPWLRS